MARIPTPPIPPPVVFLRAGGLPPGTGSGRLPGGGGRPGGGTTTPVRPRPTAPKTTPKPWSPPKTYKPSPGRTVNPTQKPQTTRKPQTTTKKKTIPWVPGVPVPEGPKRTSPVPGQTPKKTRDPNKEGA